MRRSTLTTRQTNVKPSGKPQKRSAIKPQAKAGEPSASFGQTYPAITEWVESWGWIEIGQDDDSHSMVRALDIGGLVWEGRRQYASIDALLRDLENSLAKWLKKNA